MTQALPSPELCYPDVRPQPRPWCPEYTNLPRDELMERGITPKAGGEYFLSISQNICSMSDRPHLHRCTKQTQCSLWVAMDFVPVEEQG